MKATTGNIIKSAAVDIIRPIFSDIPLTSSHGCEPQLVPTQSDPIAELSEALAARDAEIAKHEVELANAFADGEAAGRVAAEVEYEDSRVEALSLLQRGITHAQNEIKQSISALERIALDVAQEALAVLIGDKDHYRDVLQKMILSQSALLDANIIVEVAISRCDFPDSNEIADLETQLAVPKGSLRLSDELEAGRCHFVLTSGGVELDMTRSWKEISAILAAASQRELPK